MLLVSIWKETCQNEWSVAEAIPGSQSVPLPSAEIRDFIGHRYLLMFMNIIINLFSSISVLKLSVYIVESSSTNWKIVPILWMQMIPFDYDFLILLIWFPFIECSDGLLFLFLSGFLFIFTPWWRYRQLFFFTFVPFRFLHVYIESKLISDPLFSRKNS